MRFAPKWKYGSADPRYVNTYGSWKAMRNRCLNPKCIAWKAYGARGISICDRWKNSFDVFVEDMGVKPKGLSLERINNEGDYSPENCRWATWHDQCRNKRVNRIVEYQGKSWVLKDLAEQIGVHRTTISSRLDLGETIEQALRPAQKAKHGTNTGYSYGCRCEACKIGRRRYEAELRAKRIESA